MKPFCPHKWYYMGEVEKESNGEREFQGLYVCEKCAKIEHTKINKSKKKEEVKEDDWRRKL